MQLHYALINTPFTYPFTISGGRTKTHQPALIVALSLGNFTGYGEAPAISYYDITVEKMIADLEAKKTMIGKFALIEPERYWHYLHHLFPQNPFLVCALDMAAWDLFAQMNRKPLYKMLGYDWENIPQTDYTIGIDTIEKMEQKVKENPYPIYKIKLGMADDLKIVRALRSATDATFRIDVNGGWKEEEALQKIDLLKDLGVELLEQPLHKDDYEGSKKLIDQRALPIFADESCVFEKDVKKCAGYFNGINIKLTKCSGITPAVRMIKEAKSLGMKVMAGSMNETSIGTAAIANLLPALDYVDMDGPLLLSDDVASGLRFSGAVASLEQKPGLGITVNTEKINWITK